MGAKKLDFTFKIAGDRSVLVEFGDEIDEQTNRSVRFLAELIDSSQLKGVNETILGYTNLLINYDPVDITYEQLKKRIITLIKKIDRFEPQEENVIEIPVLYGSEWGPDLSDVAEFNNLTEEEVIHIHTEPSYLVYFLGFTPGFPFLGGMSEKIITPRLSNPRTRIRAGSVGIANNQTGIYPVSSPGGWRLIGHTPIPLYAPKKEWPFLLSPGDKLKFKAITKEEYAEIVNRLQKNEYNIVNEPS